MSDVLLPPAPDQQLVRVGRATATALEATLREVPSPDGDALADALVEALAHPDATTAVLRPLPAAWDVASRAGTPVLLVPPGVVAATPDLERVLAPLDGSAAAAAAVTEAARFARRDLVVLHVLDPDAAPPFWDQAAHAGDAWCDAFLARWCDRPGARLIVRSGAAADQVAEQVAAVAREQGAGLIVLGWSQNLAGRHAAVVRRTVADADVPVLLVPVGEPPDEPVDASVAGPSALRDAPASTLH